MMIVACPTCRTPSEDVVGEHRGDDTRYRCFHCAQCELEFWAPRLIKPETYRDAHVETYARRHSGEAFLRERHHLFLERAQRAALKRPRLLDVGCGEGAFLAEALRRGFDAWGLELDDASVAVARDRVAAVRHDDASARVLHGTLERGARQAGLADRRFDVVTAFEVLEHQPDPLGFLELTRDVLDDGGRLCGSVPNRGRALAALSRRRNTGDLPPHHFLWFSVAALTNMLRTAGFRDVVVLHIPERDPLVLAAYLENALLGGVTGGIKARLRTARRRRTERGAERAGVGNASKSSRGSAWGLAAVIKNAPFVPFALAVDRVLTPLRRSLYFEAVRPR